MNDYLNKVRQKTRKVELELQRRKNVDYVKISENEDMTKSKKYACECIGCGHKMKTDKHCMDIKCPECGGEMRRSGRPGPGKSKQNLQYGFSVLSKEKRHVIAGYASYVMIDSDDQLVTREALTAGLQKFMADKERRNIMFSHDGIQIGKAIDEFEGKTTHVDDVGLYMVAEIYQDIKTAEDVWEGVLEGDYNAFSICFEPLIAEDHEKDDNSMWQEVHTINLLEASVCENPKNPLSRFEILSKSRNVEEIKKGEIMTKEEKTSKTQDDKKADLDKDAIVVSINDELNKLKLLGTDIKAEDLNALAGLVTNLRTDGEKAADDTDNDDDDDEDEDEKAFVFPTKASYTEGERWPTVIARAIDDLYTQLGASEKSQKSSLDKVRKLNAEVIKKAEETDAAKKDADAAKKDADGAKKDAEAAKDSAADAKDTANKDREIMGGIQDSLKGVNTSFEKFDERLKVLENQKEVKTKVSKESLIEDYKPLNVRESQDGVEIIQDGET